MAQYMGTFRRMEALANRRWVVLGPFLQIAGCWMDGRAGTCAICRPSWCPRLPLSLRPSNSAAECARLRKGGLRVLAKRGQHGRGVACTHSYIAWLAWATIQHSFCLTAGSLLQ